MARAVQRVLEHLGFGPSDGIYGDAGDVTSEQVGVLTPRYNTQDFFVQLGNLLGLTSTPWIDFLAVWGHLRAAGRSLPARLMKSWIMRMPEPMPLGLTFLLAMVRAMVSASLVNRPLGG